MRGKFAVLCAVAVVAWLVALAASASFSNDLAYTCGSLGVAATAWDFAVARRWLRGGAR